MDALTLHYIARELNERWRARRLSRFDIDRKRRQIVIGPSGQSTVCIDLAASLPAIVRWSEASDASDRQDAGPLDGWVIGAVEAPEDERRLIVRVAKPGKFRGSVSREATLDVSLIPSARGARLIDTAGHVLASIGAALPPVAPPRRLLTAADFDDARRDAGRLREGRWMSPWLERWLMRDPEHALDRYLEIGTRPPAHPSRCGEVVLPFPFCDAPVTVDSMIPERIARAADVAAPIRRTDRALARMRRELARAHDVDQLRAAADALVTMGEAAAPAAIQLADGRTLGTGAELGESASDAAQRLYGQVRSMERARLCLPGRIAALQAKSDAVGVDTAPADEGPPVPSTKRGARSSAPAAAKPYRSYRSSGGLAIWVGRGAKSNDAVTFRESAPDDVWLHAREAAGAHVILRWQSDDAPPARDLEEAALLAAWHSRSRGAALVPVDWTRRKHVRKPRGAAPGSVTVERSATIFVRPSADAERRLRADRDPVD